MKWYLTLIISISSVLFVKAQVRIERDAITLRETTPLNEAIESKDRIYSVVEQSATVKGKIENFDLYFTKSIRYPESIKTGDITKIIISFVVEKDGSLSNYTFYKLLPYDVQEEITRVLNESPKWIPAKNNGEIVRQEIISPIVFEPYAYPDTTKRPGDKH